MTMSRHVCNECATRQQCALRPLVTDPAFEGHAVHERRLDAGGSLLQQGEPARALHAIKVGAVLLRRNPGLGGARAVGVLGAGHVLSLRALLADGPGTDAVAVVPTRVCEVPLPLVRALLPSRPALVAHLARHQVRVTETLADWSAVARLPDALSRVAAVLGLLAREQGTRTVVLPARDDLAELAGCAPETTSRALARLQRDGLLRREGRRHLVWEGPIPNPGKTRGGGGDPVRRLIPWRRHGQGARQTTPHRTKNSI
ncbi:CRP/FNR family transcriptional regulator [Tepidimonas ignava]|uniref:CRP/FNR family transcriptional regulator n=2 Tax=Tepidimonas ignava TaxID=114249 RepID=A0A4R3LF15_9BURK|nr:CRP/FNR family transcriptional regulator [Tepidimonas ignava]